MTMEKSRSRLRRHALLLPCLVFLTMLKPTTESHLRHNYYRNVCPNVESVVRNAVSRKLQQTFVAAPATLRMFFHDCFVRGCDASVMLVSPKGNDERHSSIDLSLAGDGFDTVVKAKAAVDSDPRCKNKVSCADILAMAARDVISMTGGPYYEVELGRLDGRISTRASVRHRLPLPEFKLDALNAMFASHGLSQTDMVALSGGHTIGFSHCNKVQRRVFNFRKSRIDPTVNPDYARSLRKQCPIHVDPRAAISLDPTTPQVFDNVYFKNLEKGMGLLLSDQILYTDPRSRPTVELFASNQTAFEEAFVAAITKLGRVGVKVGKHGEIRRDCNLIN